VLARLWPIFAVLLISLAGCSDAPTEAECKKLMEHLIEVEQNAAGGSAVSPELADDAKAVKKRVLGYLEEDFMKSCKKSLPKGQLECGMKATKPSDLAACDEG